ncbi:FAD-dependent oxidoreductase, partial [Candidatus Bathyarchaeota archaeon]
MENVRVGVFISECGGHLSKVLDINALMEYLRRVPGVSLVERGNEFWRGEGLRRISEAVAKGVINRVVVSESLPKMKGLNIIKTVEKAGLNPYQIEIIDLKGHCAIPHRRFPVEATEKAKAMLLAAIEKVKLSKPIEKIEFQVLDSVLVIGGGISGIQAAMDLAELGFKVYLVERKPFLG